MNRKQVLELIDQKCCCGGNQEVPTPETGCCYEVITLEQARLLAANSLIIPNKKYKITGVHKNKVYTEELPIYVPVLFDDGTNSGIAIYLTGLSPTEFSTEGWGEFWNPKYNHAQYSGATDSEQKSIYLTTAPLGTGYSDGTNVATLTSGAGTGLTVDIITDAGVIIDIKINNPGTGYIHGDSVTVDAGNTDAVFTYIVGSYQGLYDIYDGENPYAKDRPAGYVVGATKIWGNYVWENLTGRIGNAATYTSLNPEDWEKRAYNSTDYNKVIDYIEYDFANDWILRRKQSEPVIDVIFPFQFWNGNTNGNPISVDLHGIAVAQWGNKYTATTGLGSGLVQVNDAYFEFANFKGRNLLGFQLDKYSVVKNNYRGWETIFDGIKIDNYSYQSNCIFTNYAAQRYITLSNYSWQSNVRLGKYLYRNPDRQEYLTFNNVGYQIDITLEWGSYQKYMTFENYSGQTAFLLTSDSQGGDPQPSYQEFILMQNRSEPYQVTLNHACSQSHITFISSQQSSVTLEHNSGQANMHFENGSGQSYIHLDELSLQSNMTFSNNSWQRNNEESTNKIESSTQSGITFENGAGQANWAMLGASQTNMSYNGQYIDYADEVMDVMGSANQESKTTALHDKIVFNHETTFTGAAGLGLVGAIDLPDLYVPAGYFISEVAVKTSGLTFGAGSYITLGIGTDDIDSGLDITSGDCATLAGTPIFMLNSLPFTQASAVRRVVAAVNVANITAGVASFNITFRKL